jgi:flagellar basal-body rod protein FlgG
MNEVLALSLQSMHGDMARLDQVGMNLANVLTSGYKRTVALQAPITANFAGHLASAGDLAQAAAAPTVQFAADLRAGTLKSTGQPLDLAISGKGFFEVMTPEGPAYTRQGSFQVDARGRLVTPQGYAVMGTAGEITLDSAQPAISASGAMTSPLTNNTLAQLKLVDFEAGTAPQRLGDGLFAAAAGMKQLNDDEVQVRQGFLENSNAASTLEMASLVQAMRHFEGMQKVVQGYDEMLGLAIRKLGETS